MCYNRRMTQVASRELRNRTRALLERVASGEEITITVNGRPVATLSPAAERPQWMARERFVETILSRQADSALAADLASITGHETTADLPPT